MEFSSRPKIRRKPSSVQRATCNAVEALEAERGRRVTATDVRDRVQARLSVKTVENRLHEYTRRGWLRAAISRKRGKPTVYGITDAWIDLLDAVDNDSILVSARDIDRVGPCEGQDCNATVRLIYYKGRRLCSACLNPEYKFQAGDATHPLVRTNWGAM